MAVSFEVPRRLRAFVRARETSLALLASGVGAIAGIVVAAMSAAVDVLHMVLFGLEPGQRLSAASALDPRLAVGVPVIGGALFRAQPLSPVSVAAGARGRSHRGQRVAWRPHVAARQLYRDAADDLVERRRSVGRPGGRLHPDGERHRVVAGPALSPAPQRSADDGRSRRRRCHRGRFSGAARGRLLCLRAHHWRLQRGEPRAGRARGSHGLSGFARFRPVTARHHCGLVRRGDGTRSRHRGPARRLRRICRHRADARRGALRVAVHACRHRDPDAAHDRRFAGRAFWRWSRRR